MKLWHLKRLVDVEELDEIHEIVVRAKSPKAARKLAAGASIDEGPEVWLDIKQSSCEMLKKDGKPGVIVCYAAGF